MKIFLLTFVVLIGVNYGLTQDSSQVRRVREKANSFINSLEDWATYQGNVLRNTLVTQADLLINQMISTKNILGSIFNTFEGTIQVQRSIWLSKMEDFINKLRYQLSTDSVDAILIPVLNQQRAAYIDPRYFDLENLEAAIKANVTLVSCWDKNEKSVKLISEKLMAKVESIIGDDLNSLKSKFIATISKIKTLVDVFNNDLIGCNSDSVCGYRYIQANFAEFLGDINVQTTAGSRAWKTTIENILRKVNSTNKEIEDEYKAGPRAQITACLAKG